MKSHSVRVSPKSNMTCVLIREETQIHRGECHVVTETETGVVHLQANAFQDD